MNYISLFSGIEAATVAWQPLGWKAQAYSEVDPFCCALLEQKYPDTPNHGDVTQYDWSKYRGSVDLVIGGSPCQAFSIAGKKQGLADDRGNLTLSFIRALDAIRPRWFIWENVPGVLSIDSGRTFGQILHEMGECRYQCCWRILDAQFWGVPQRRRRVFLVGYLGNWRPPGAVLFERESLQGNTEASREAGEKDTGSTAQCFGRNNTSGAISASGQRLDFASDTFVAQPLKAHHPRANIDETLVFNWNASVAQSMPVESDLSVPLKASRCSEPAICIQGNTIRSNINHGAKGAGFNINQSFTLTSSDRHAVAFAQNSRDELREMPYSGALAAQPGMKQQSFIRESQSVRRLTPLECERLQGFPDYFTAIQYRNKPASDTQRYKAIGNSMAVNVIRWLGERIELVESVMQQQNRAA